MTTNIYAFYNNKGGVGKTTLCQNAACLYADKNPDELVLVIDLCPQANISQFLLGGGRKGYNANQKLQSQATRRNIVGFMDWLLKGNSAFTSIPASYMHRVSRYNPAITKNVHLIAGDSFLESLALALNFATMNPGNVNAWKEYVTAIRRLCDYELAKTEYDTMTVFIDCNPSFSVYTQMALVSSDNIILPVMADFSSLEGIKGIMMLLYGKYPSSAAKTYADKVLTFNKQINTFGLSLPNIFEIPFNNFTANMGVANAYGSIRNEISEFAWQQYKSDPSIFAQPVTPPTSNKQWEAIYMSNVKDFHTSGKVSASLGIPLHKLPQRASYTMPDGTEIKLPKDNYRDSLIHLSNFVNKL
ncbi:MULTISPECIES: ParA family protein [unclassified Leisingera]|uniref:ParA family protein n=1 Tax=unclassified Leisingera TaxID=2614906 RepID=UPI0010129142|nr:MULTISPECIES: ParA family protein [unclassified Leisingera]MCF6433430.1 ParA family protein [Leisingera sp. MMG026]QAX32409.1 ParA family protein [Leisingera sp. NJS204]